MWEAFPGLSQSDRTSSQCCEGDLCILSCPYDFAALLTLGRGTKLFALCPQMSDVEAGGATVFPDLGAAIWPKKVSVILHALKQSSDLISVPQYHWLST